MKKYAFASTMGRLAALFGATLISVGSLHAHLADGTHKHDGKGGIAATTAVVTGWGEYAYRSVPNWCKPNEKQTIGTTNGSVAVDKAGLIYLPLEAGPEGILVYNDAGEFQRAIANDYFGIHNLIIREEEGVEYIYAAHGKGRQAVKMKLDGTVLWTLPYPKESGKYKGANQYNPTAIAIGPQGQIFVADGYGQQWVHQYDADRNYVRSFGGRGRGNGQFNVAHSIAIDPRGETPRLVVCDRENGRLQYFDLEGNFLHVVPVPLRRPTDIRFFGDIAAVAELQGRVAILDKDNEPVSVLGDNPNRGHWANFGLPPQSWVEGTFSAPHGLAFDAKGNLIVMDWNRFGRVTRLNRIAKADAPAAPMADAFAGDPATYGQVISSGKDWQASSTSNYDPKQHHKQLFSTLPPTFLAAYAFHTGNDLKPWVQVDLAEKREIRAATVWNRADGVPERAAQLAMQVSEDGETWTQVWQAESVAPKWEIDLKDKNLSARYVRFQVMQDNPTYLHLQNVRIYGR